MGIFVCKEMIMSAFECKELIMGIFVCLELFMSGFECKELIMDIGDIPKRKYECWRCLK
jgi:hypothetical protein